MTDHSNRVSLFNHWAPGYDADTNFGLNEFPFGGYQAVLDAVLNQAAVAPYMDILDLGSGTGNLSTRFVNADCQVTGLDFALEMVRKAQTKLPQARFLRADILDTWPEPLQRRFDRVVSGYVFHEFPLAEKISLVHRIVEHHLHAGGRLVIGDISFSSREARSAAHQRYGSVWDEDEYYWAADETLMALDAARLNMAYTQVAPTAGIYVFTLK